MDSLTALNEWVLYFSFLGRVGDITYWYRIMQKSRRTTVSWLSARSFHRWNCWLEVLVRVFKFVYSVTRLAANNFATAWRLLFVWTMFLVELSCFRFSIKTHHGNNHCWKPRWSAKKTSEWPITSRYGTEHVSNRICLVNLPQLLGRNRWSAMWKLRVRYQTFETLTICPYHSNWHCILFGALKWTPVAVPTRDFSELWHAKRAHCYKLIFS